MEFNEFCKTAAKHLGLEFCPYVNDERHATTMRATESLPNPKYFVDFTDLSFGHPYFIGEVFDKEKRLYIGTISFENYDGKKEFEHFETQVSPNGRYNENFMPINEKGEEVDGEIWQFYCGSSLKRACNSLLKGGAVTNPSRKPIRVW